MYVDNIFINGGRLIAGSIYTQFYKLIVFVNLFTGSPTTPFNGTIDIILTNSGPVTVVLPQYFPVVGPRIIAVLGGLDLHGKSTGVTWTRLSRTARSGEYFLNLNTAIAWTIGDEIIVTTTDIDISHTERHRIADIINETVIRTSAPLAYTHNVILKTFSNGQEVHVAAAVGLLTRNIRISSNDIQPGQSGFRIVVIDYSTSVWYSCPNQYYFTYYKGYARLSNIQFRGFGRMDDSSYSDQYAGIYLSRLGNYNQSRPTFIQACSFDTGSNAA